MADRIVDVSKVSEFTMDGYPGQYLRNIVAKDDELGFGLHYVRIAEGHSLPEHTHDGIEVVYLLSGTADGMMDGEVTPVGADTALVVPKEVNHSLVNTGKGDLLLLAFFYPPLL